MTEEPDIPNNNDEMPSLPPEKLTLLQRYANDFTFFAPAS